MGRVIILFESTVATEVNGSRGFAAAGSLWAAVVPTLPT